MYESYSNVRLSLAKEQYYCIKPLALPASNQSQSYLNPYKAENYCTLSFFMLINVNKNFCLVAIKTAQRNLANMSRY